MGTLGGPDVWKINADDRSKHDQQFFSLKPVNGLISGEQARGYFILSGLPSAVLAQIWNLADLNKDGKMDKKEFSIAVHLIQKKLQGFTLPTTLPESMKADPTPVIGTFGGAPGGFAAVPPPVQQPPMVGGWGGQQMAAAPSPVPYGVYGSPPTSTTGASPITVRSKVDWSLPHNSKLKYSQTFNNIDKNRTGFLTGVHARNVLSQYGLPNNLLAQIWQFSDLDKDGRLSCDEFCLAMHLIDMVKLGETLPPTLPPEATSFMRQRQPSLGNSSMVQVADDATAPSILSSSNAGTPASFEDKRKQNFDRGQAELERRRQILLEQESRERAERERKEREEFEKQERERLEMERRRQLEMEKQMAKQREEQQKREEEYRKVIEQREAARRELEKQRQVELERQRVHELMVQRQQEQEMVCHLKQKEKNLNFQLQALNEKSNDLNNLITEVREKIVGITSSIEGMKRDRDSKLLDIETSKRQTQEVSMMSGHLMRERQVLEDHRMNVVGGGNAQQIDDSYRQVMHTYRNKSMNMESLRQSLADIERDLETRQTASRDRQQQLNELRQTLERETKENNELTQKVVAAQASVRKMAPNHAHADGWAGAGVEPAGVAANGEATTRYRAVYEFTARSEDELSFQPGDVILVFRNHVGEPGWLAGQIKDKVGWFPEAFAECVDSNAGVPDQSPTESKLMTVSKLDSINEESFDSSASHGVARAAPESVVAERHKNGVGTSSTTTEAKKAVAHFQFKAKKDNHLAFNKGDVINVLEMQEMWWMGELDGKSGWFPKSYVKLIDGAVERRKSETTPSMTTALKPTTSISQEFPSQSFSTAPSGGGGKWYVACYPFPEMEKGDLKFDAGERIFVTQQDGEWWTGQCNGREGTFPANYVQPLDDNEQQPPMATQASVDENAGASTPAEYATIRKTSNEPSSPVKQPSVEITSPTRDEATTREEFEVGKVIAPFKAEESNHLTLEVGDLIKIRSKSPTGWWQGELQRKGQDKKIGWFPGNYVKILGAGGGGKKDSKDDKRETVMAMFDYTSQQDDELSLNRGDILLVLEKIDADWWRGEMTANGQQGLFPANYVQPYAGVERIPETTREQQQQQEQQANKTLSPSTPTRSAPGENNATNGNGANKRTMYCQELLHTEQNYFDDLHMVKEVFYKQFASSKTLTADELHELFVNWDDLSRVSKFFMKSLRQYGEDRVGRAVLQTLNELRAFVTFCQYQQNSLEFLESKSKSSAQFQSVHAQCCQHPAARGLPLSHFLLIPMTRVTKYPLVLKEILKYTPDDHGDRESLEKALTALKDLCDEVNRVATETENLQMLYWCQNHVKCETIQPKFVFQSSTNFLGPRKFVHFGVLYKAKSNRLLIGLLFNDVFLLTTPDEAIDHPDSFKLSRTSELVLSLYKQPILLHKSSLQMPPSLTGVESGDDTLFALNNGELTISFKAVSSNGRLLWQKQLEKAIKHAKLEHFQFQTNQQIQQPSSTSHPKTGIGRLLIEIVVLRNLNVPNDCKNSPIQVELTFGEQKTTKSVDLTKNETPLCTTQFVIETKTGVFSMSVYVERLYQPNLHLGKAELPLLDMMKMSGLQKNPAMKQLPLISETADAGEELTTQQVIIKFVVQMFEGQ